MDAYNIWYALVVEHTEIPTDDWTKEMKVKKLHKDAIIPSYATKGAACFDFHTLTPGYVDDTRPLVCSTGLAFAIPQDHVMLIFSRSGHGFNNDVRLANCVGVIDSDYRGEVKIKLSKDSGEDYFVNKFDRIAQGLMLPIKQVSFIVVDELDDTERGDNGFGSTGV